jgi:teichoic acid transport system permease protein
MTVTDPAADLHPLTTVMPAREYLAAMWSRRDFAIALPLEEVRSAHQDTLLGNVWHLANPMLSVAVATSCSGSCSMSAVASLEPRDRGVAVVGPWLGHGLQRYRRGTL